MNDAEDNHLYGLTGPRQRRLCMRNVRVLGFDGPFVRLEISGNDILRPNLYGSPLDWVEGDWIERTAGRFVGPVQADPEYALTGRSCIGVFVVSNGMAWLLELVPGWFDDDLPVEVIIEADLPSCLDRGKVIDDAIDILDTMDEDQDGDAGFGDDLAERFRIEDADWPMVANQPVVLAYLNRVESVLKIGVQRKAHEVMSCINDDELSLREVGRKNATIGKMASHLESQRRAVERMTLDRRDARRRLLESEGD